MSALARKAAVLALALAAVLTAAPAFAQDAGPAARVFDATTLNISADGQVQAAPDQATITLGVQTQGASAAEAMGANATQMSAVMAALSRAGVPDRDIRTSNLSLAAQYSYPQNAPQVLTGYAATNEVTVILDDVTAVGRVIDAASGAGANQIEGISFGLKDATAAQDAARLAAVKALSAKAALYAEAAGYRAERLVNLTEGSPVEPGPVRPMMAMARVAGVPTQVSPGQLTVQVTVSGVYELTK